VRVRAAVPSMDGRRSNIMEQTSTGHEGEWHAHSGVQNGLVVVTASDGPVLGWGKPPKHQGEARPRLNTCASPAGARRPRAVTPSTCLDINNGRAKFQRSREPHPRSEQPKQHSALKFNQSFFDPPKSRES